MSQVSTDGRILLSMLILLVACWGILGWVDLPHQTRAGFDTNGEWQKLADGVADLRFADSGARAFSRFIFSGAYEVELDKQGRLVLPATLREFAHLGSDVIVAGAGQHIELWPPERWAEYSAELSNPEVLATRIGDLGI